MTTRFEDAMEDLRERSQGPCLLETQKYLRDLHASHEALLKAVKSLEACVKKAPFNVLKDANAAIRAAEELGK